MDSRENSVINNIDPILSTAKIFGLEYLSTRECSVRQNYVYNFFFKTYTHLVEIFLWGIVLFILMTIMTTVPCGNIFMFIYSNNVSFAVITFLIMSLYMAIQFSIIKRRKISFHCAKSKYHGEDEFIIGMETYLLALFSVTFLIFIIISLLIFIIYSQMRKENSEMEAFYCSIITQFVLLFLLGQFMSVFAFLAIIFFVAGKRFVELSKELIVRKCATRQFLQDIMEKHTEMWEFLQHLNDRWALLFPVIYLNFMYVSCFELYAVLFIDMDQILRLCLCFILLPTILGSISVAWGISIFTSLIYDNFQSVDRFSSICLTLQYKFKIIGFMKRFGRRPMGISMAGFFFIKRNFVIRMIYGIYSVFSSLVQVTGVMNRKKCLSGIKRSVSKLNSTVL